MSKMMKKINGLAAASLLGLSIMACSSSSAVDKNVVDKSEAFVVPPASGYVKPGADVQMIHNYKGFSNPGEIESLSVSFVNNHPNSKMTVTLTENPEINLFNDIREHQFASGLSKQGEMEIQFSPRSDLKPSLSFITTVETADGQVWRRAHTIPLRFNKPGAESKSYKRATAKSDTDAVSGGVVVMDAQETIKSK